MTYHETIIIGAGPAGLQTAYFLDRCLRDYKILERGSCSGTFFARYPISKKLISFNKRYTGSTNADFNLRYDWNSLLNEDELLFTSYSCDIFPSSDDLVRYLNDFAFGMNISYNTKVEQINKHNDGYSINTNNEIFTCKYLIIATGMIPQKQTFQHYGDFTQTTFDGDTEFDGKNVMIVGSGNSAYELASLLASRVKRLILFGKMIKLSSFTHYPGDLRGNYLSNIDLFSLKLLSFTSKNEEYVLESDFTITDEGYETKEKLFVHNGRHKYDHVIFCNGFCFDTSIFNFDVNHNGKYPKLNYKYESENNKNLFFAGTLMHGVDKPVKSSGGFIHGFRYLIRYLVQTIYTSYTIELFNSKTLLSEFIFRRINECSSLYLMFNFMCDLVYYEGENYFYVQDVTTEYIKQCEKSKYFTLKTSYGAQPTTYEDLYTIGFSIRANPRLIHFILTFVDGDNINEIKFEEDIFGLFDSEDIFLTKIKRVINVFA